jgi:hypothetical protein
VWPNTASRIWGEPIAALVERLRSFTVDAFERGNANRSPYDHIPQPNRRGRGVRKQRAFREAFSRALVGICENYPLTKEAQDRIVATITSVVFSEWPVDTETIRRHRQKQRRKQEEGDKSAQ